MESVYSDKITEIKRERKFLEKTLKVKISIKDRFVSYEGDPLDEYLASSVFEAINLGFSARIATLITDEEFVFEKLNIKDFTRRKDLDVIRGRLIGTHGRTKNTLEQISHCHIKIKGNIVGIISHAESIQQAITAITNIIKGTKQSNVYKYLERINTERKKRRE